MLRVKYNTIKIISMCRQIDSLISSTEPQKQVNTVTVVTDHIATIFNTIF